MGIFEKITVSFPGLGIDNFEVSREAFKIADTFSIMWYGVVIALGMLIAIGYASFRCKQMGIKIDDLIDIAIFTIFFGVIGARLFYVIHEPENFPTLGSIINLRSGGLAIYGGIIVGAITIIIVCLIKKISWRKLWDAAGPGVMMAQAIGRWGNFFNGEAFGEQIAEGHPLYFMRMGLISYNSYLKFGTTEMVYIHPTFLYESLWNVFGFILINIFYKKKKFDGEVALWYISWYGFGRMFIEGLRTDSLVNAGIRSSQLIGFLCFTLATAIVIYGRIVTRKQEKVCAVTGEGTVVEGAEEVEEPVTEKEDVKTEEAQETVEENAENKEENG